MTEPFIEWPVWTPEGAEAELPGEEWVEPVQAVEGGGIRVVFGPNAEVDGYLFRVIVNPADKRLWLTRRPGTGNT